ncbi:hypothetical protein E1T77_08805 [Listeria monocytogenes]|uniref:hypothetical protein n=1 Tax=Listeria monocytogenes TaxID=1639 RepID=UPI000BDF71DB|nr:hypothetical protein [Listeria monocytogenes]EAE2830366.1 hypothetical protein [Listeria monocytogenes]EAE3075734.1 hypothetical protein [Listeria monocytogenes]EAE3196410.1 hypothetical protein [Listeria monocytogenes]EAE3243732.1 hypothetical protein [Listeria monocytogenes]EAE3272959.1 hypothetical protein [Listeria monocytogenes]
MIVLGGTSPCLDLNKTHHIEFTTSELIYIIACLGEVTDFTLNEALSDTSVFTNNFSQVVGTNLYDELLKYGCKENIIKKEFLF